MSDNGNKRAGIYARVSNWDKAGDSIASQLEMARRYCAENGYTVAVEFADRQVKGSDLDAPGLARALELADAGEFQVLVVRELDRFARSLGKQLAKEAAFEKAGAAIEYILEEYEDTPEGRLKKHVRAIIAEYNQAKIRERILRGRRRSAERGNVFVADNPGLGYRLATVQRNGRDTRTLAIVEEEAEIVRRIFDWYVYGDPGHDVAPLSDRKIAQRLTAGGVLTKWDREKPGRRRTRRVGYWSQSSVARILKNPVYKGEWTFTEVGANIVVPVPAIVDEALWERARRKRAQARRRSPKNTVHSYLLRGRATCASCGYTLTSYAHKLYRKAHLYYRCNGNTGRADLAHHCDSGSYRAGEVDAVIWAALQLVIGDPEVLRGQMQLEQDAEQQKRLNERLDQARRQLEESDASLGRLLALTITGKHSERHFHRHQVRLEVEIERRQEIVHQIEKQIADQAARRQRAVELSQLVAQFQSALASAGDDFNRRRWIVETLDVTVQLETDPGGTTRRAHLEIEGEPIMTIDLPPKRGQGHRQVCD